MAALVGLLAAIGIAVGSGANFDAAQGQAAGQGGPGASQQAR